MILLAAFLLSLVIGAITGFAVWFVLDGLEYGFIKPRKNAR